MMKMMIVMFNRIVVMRVIKINRNVVGDSKLMEFNILVRLDSLFCKMFLMLGFVVVFVLVFERLVFCVVV